MNEEIEYAQMLEIPVSTINVVHKKSKQKRKKSADVETPNLKNTDLKYSVIDKINTQMGEETAEESVENPSLQLDIPERIDTVRLYSQDEKEKFSDDFHLSKEEFTFDEMEENDGGRYALNDENPKDRRLKIALGVEFALSCALCGAIFFTNIFMPNSAINTFFRTIGNGKNAEQADTRAYTDFALTPVVSDRANVELTLSPAGVLSFTGECCVYPSADGKVQEVSQNGDGTYTVKLQHSDTFSGVIVGLESVFYQVGDSVKAHVPVGYTNGEGEVQVTMYSDGALLNCFELTQENCLVWVQQN